MNEEKAPQSADSAAFSIGGTEAWETQERLSLQQNFLPTDAFDAISERDKTFLCGRRGTGKSAIALMLERTSPLPYREAVQGEISEYGAYMDAVLDLRTMVAPEALDLRKAISRLWLWALPVKAMQAIVAQATDGAEPMDEHLASMASYLDSFQAPLHPRSRIGDLLACTFESAVQSLSVDPAAFSRHLLGLTSTPAFLAAVRALTIRSASRPVLLVFDTLESYRVFEPDMVEGLRGVLQAVMTFVADRRMENVALKFFLPAEIYHPVFASFPGKVASRAVFLRWRSPDLIAMLARRYLAILERTGTLPEVDRAPLQQSVDEAYRIRDTRRLRRSFWYASRFLPPKIRNRLGIEEDTFAFMVRHTQRRPRDLITQMQSIIDAARSRSEFPYISASTVIEGVHRKRVLEQIVADAFVPYEGELPRALSGASAIFYGRSRSMTKKELRSFSQELYALYPLTHVAPTDFLNALFRCGLIGVVEDDHAPGQQRTYCRARFSYLNEEELPWADRFEYCVHPSLGDLLNMATAPGKGVVYPAEEPGEEEWLEQGWSG